MKKTAISLLVLVVIVLSIWLAAGCSSTSTTTATVTATATTTTTAKVYTMGIQLMHVRTQALVQQVFIPFNQTLEQRSGGRIKVDLYDSATVAPNAGVVSALASNTLQGAYINPLWEPGRYPLCDLFEVPMQFPSATVGCQVSQHLLDTFPEYRNQWPAGVKIMSGFSTALIQLVTTKPVKTMADLKGLRMLAPTALQVQICQLLGANPITLGTVSLPDFYVTIQRGTADGTCFPLTPLRAQKIGEVAPYVTIADLTASVFVFGVSQQFYDSLPPDLQKILDEETGMKLAKTTGQVGLDEASMPDVQWLKDNLKMQFYTLPDGERAAWKAQLASIKTDLVKKLTDQGYPAQAMLDEMGKYSSQLVSQGAFIPSY